MRPRFAHSITALAIALAAQGFGQQGRDQGQYQGNSLQAIERSLTAYLNGDELKSILTPGEFCEWKLDLKAGQVVIGEARSDAFDPALEVLDDQDKVLASNDDRYPGDQRPLLLWRCPADGSYSIHVRSFQGRAGGQTFVRFKTYESVDLASGTMVEQEMDARAPFLLRVPMKTGQIKEVLAEGGDRGYVPIVFNQAIFPNGLPERAPSLGEAVRSAAAALIAPAAGDYYLLYSPTGRPGTRGKVRVGTREIVPAPLARDGGTITATATTRLPKVWELSVKAGELLEASLANLDPNCQFSLAEAPDFTKFDVSKPETNPFFPTRNDQPQGGSPAFDLLPARARDNRILVFRARRDAKLWLASNGAAPSEAQYTLQIKAAPAVFEEDQPQAGTLRIGNTDYWAFDANAGDVLSLDTSAPGFAEQVIVRDPDLAEVRHTIAALDQHSDAWKMTVQKPGRYLVAVSCLGDGGGGGYSLSRKVIHPREFAMGNPAKAEISSGQIQVWKFTATPDKPLLIHWNSSNWNYDFAIYDEAGNRTDFQRQPIDDQNVFGLLKVDKPRTYIIVLTGTGAPANYSIALNPIPREDTKEGG